MTLRLNIPPRRCECLCGAVLVEGVGEPVIGTCAICALAEKGKDQRAMAAARLRKRKKPASKVRLSKAEEDALFESVAKGE